MSLQLLTILSPPTPGTPVLRSLSSPQARSRSYRSPFPGRLPFWASPFPSRLANACGRIEFIIVLIMDWSFASGCSPPRLSATQLPSATDSQCSVRWGLPPHCWCALSGALGRLAQAPRTCRPPKFRRLTQAPYKKTHPKLGHQYVNTPHSCFFPKCHLRLSVRRRNTIAASGGNKVLASTETTIPRWPCAAKTRSSWSAFLANPLQRQR